MKKALIYDPYLDTMGGGERYALTFAQALKSVGYSVTFAWPDRRTLSDSVIRFNLESDFACDAIAYGVFVKGSLFSKWNFTKQYDLVFFISDGSLPFLFGKKNFIHFQVPFTKIGGNIFTNIIKIFFTHGLIFNSNFTAKVIKKQLPFYQSTIIYPPVDSHNFVPGKKENIILSVARFDSPSHAKRQDVLIEAFRLFHQKNKGFKLILAGGLKGEDDYLVSLKTKARGLPIEFFPNPNFGELKKLYAKAKIFWHAAGWGVDELVEPEKVEHFGISTVEAMAAGAVPVVINKGGQREIVTYDVGFLCNSVEDMALMTDKLLNSPDEWSRLSPRAVERASHFSQTKFEEKVRNLVK